MEINLMNRGTVLYAEDDENDAFLMERAFRKAEFPNLKMVSDGQGAVDYLRAASANEDRAAYPLPFLVLLDINMPHLSGLEALAWIRQQPGYEDLPVVIFTSSTQEKDFRTAYSNGATAYVVKPNNAAALVEIARTLRGLSLAESVTTADCTRLPGYQPPAISPV